MNDLRDGLRPDVQRDAGRHDGLHRLSGPVDGRPVDRVPPVNRVSGQAQSRCRRPDGREEHRVREVEQSQVQGERPGRRVQRPDESGQGGVPFQVGRTPARGASRRLFRTVQVLARAPQRRTRKRVQSQLGQGFRPGFQTVSVHDVHRQKRFELQKSE